VSEDPRKNFCERVEHIKLSKKSLVLFYKIRNS